MSELIQFIYNEENEDKITEPVSCGKEYGNIAENYKSLVRDISTDAISVYDAMMLGWYIYPPVNENIYTSDIDHLESDFSEIEVKKIHNGKVLLTIDSLLKVSVPENVNLLLTNPLYDLNSPVVNQIFTKSEEEIDVVITLSVDECQVVRHDLPLAQVIPISDEELAADSEYGLPNEAINKKLKQKTALEDIYDSPYREKSRDRKQINNIINK